MNMSLCLTILLLFLCIFSFVNFKNINKVIPSKFSNTNLVLKLYKPFESNLVLDSIEIFNFNNEIIFTNKTSINDIVSRPIIELSQPSSINLSDINFILLKSKNNVKINGTIIQILSNNIVRYQSEIINFYDFNYLKYYPISNKIEYYGKFDDLIKSSFGWYGGSPCSLTDSSGCVPHLRGFYWDSKPYNPVSNEIVSKSEGNICAAGGLYWSSATNTYQNWIMIGQTVKINNVDKCRIWERIDGSNEQVRDKDIFKYLNKYENDGLSWKILADAPLRQNRSVNITNSKIKEGTTYTIDFRDSPPICKTESGKVGGLYGRYGPSGEVIYDTCIIPQSSKNNTAMMERVISANNKLLYSFSN